MIRYMIQESISVIRFALIPTDRDIVRENLPLSLYIYRYTFDAVIKDSVLKERKSKNGKICSLQIDNFVWQKPKRK